MSPAASSMPSKAPEPTPEAAAAAAPTTTTALQQNEQQQQQFAVGPRAITLHQAVFGFAEAALEHQFGEFKLRHMQGIDSVMVAVKVLKVNAGSNWQPCLPLNCSTTCTMCAGTWLLAMLKTLCGCTCRCICLPVVSKRFSSH